MNKQFLFNLMDVLLSITFERVGLVFSMYVNDWASSAVMEYQFDLAKFKFSKGVHLPF